MTLKKTAKRNSRKTVVRRKGTVRIDHWPEVLEHILSISTMLSRCQHDREPLTVLFSKLYVCGFIHGLANGLARGKNPKARKIKYASQEDLPQNLVAKCVQKFLFDIEIMHAKEIDSHHLPAPISRNN